MTELKKTPRVFEGMSQRQYDKAVAYLGVIARRIEYPRDEMENVSGRLSYFLDDEQRQIVYTIPEERRIELSDEVDIFIANRIKRLNTQEQETLTQ